MASLAEMLTASTLEANQRAGQGLPEAVMGGIQLAQRNEELKQKRADLELGKEKLNAAKDEQLHNMFIAATKMDARAMKVFMAKDGPFRRHRDAIGKTQDFPDEKLDWISLTPAHMLKARTVIEDARSGKLPGGTAAALAVIYDEKNYPDLIPYQEELAQEAQEAGKQYLANKAAERAAEQKQGGTQARFNESLEYRKGQDYKDRLIKLGGELSKEGLIDMRTSVDNLVSLIPKGLSNDDPNLQLPGISGVDSKIPLNQLKDPRAIKYRQALSGLANNIIKMRSGSAVTDSEAIRSLSELGYTASIGEGGGIKTAFVGLPKGQTVLTGIRNAERLLAERENVKRNTYGDDVYNEATRKRAAPAKPKLSPEQRAELIKKAKALEAQKAGQ